MKTILNFLHNAKCFTFISFALVGISITGLWAYSLIDDDYIVKLSVRPFGFAFVNQAHYEDEMRARLRFMEGKAPAKAPVKQ